MKKTLKIAGIVLLALLLVVLAYVVYVFLSYHRIEDNQPLPERFRIYKPCNNQDNWDNAALAFASVYWYQTVFKDEMFFKDDVSFVPADLNF